MRGMRGEISKMMREPGENATLRCALTLSGLHYLARLGLVGLLDLAVLNQVRRNSYM